MSHHIRWINTATGRLLGWKTVTLTSASDYGCVKLPSCQVGAGWIPDLTTALGPLDPHRVGRPVRVPQARVERATFRLGGGCSIH